jgi:hypothetical protein
MPSRKPVLRSGRWTEATPLYENDGKDKQPLGTRVQRRASVPPRTARPHSEREGRSAGVDLLHSHVVVGD